MFSFYRASVALQRSSKLEPISQHSSEGKINRKKFNGKIFPNSMTMEEKRKAPSNQSLGAS